ncbi:MAG: ATP-dependent helicase HrpB [Desulfobulbaceae bacterium]|nr:ATP-dependent helicase HrpB [Desulfobulbaceae bacterium]
MPLPAELPIFSIIPQLRDMLREKQAAVLSSPPGSGKTTVVPLVLLEEPWLAGRSILMLEPRRLAAKMAARRMAALLDEPVGRTVGYRVRFDSKVTSATRIEVVTEGILTRRLQNDPGLMDTGLVIFDEFHERSLHADLALALGIDVMKGLRDDLKILIMSATLDVENITGLLEDAGIVRGAGREYPVDIRYVRETVKRSGSFGLPENTFSFRQCIEQTKKGIIEAAAREHGDILAFLPGAGEIRKTAEQLAAWAAGEAMVVYPLHGSLPGKMQDKAVLPDPAGRRRLVLATSIAETSLTLEGVRVVVDSGWSRVQRFDPNSGLSHLSTVRVSRASAEQRCGRAGRMEPGICYRLWDGRIDRELKPYSRPEIMDADLSRLVLELAHWGVDDPGRLQWLDLPPSGHYSQAVELLTLLGALDSQGRITSLGKQMAALPVHPRLARMLVAAEQNGGTGKACDLAALLAERDIFRSGEGSGPADIEARLQVLADFRRAKQKNFTRPHADPVSGTAVENAARQFRCLLQKGKTANKEVSAGALLACAYPDRIAQLRPSSHDRYVLANGRGARLPEGDHLVNTPYLVAAHLDAGRTEGRIYLAAAITLDEIFITCKDSIQKVEVVSWDSRREEVVMAEQVRLQQLILTSTSLAEVVEDVVRQAMLDGIRQMGIDSLPWTGEARTLQARILLLRGQQSDLPWPDCSDQALLDSAADWFGPYLSGITRRRHLSRLDMTAILKNRLTWKQQQQLDELAPTHIRVPSGSGKRLQYSGDGPPVLAVRLQELFGLEDTPGICGGRMKVMLHLLSPAGRPIQITRDLQGFWSTTYPEIKKELQGRYPRHHWPDNPQAAIPTAGVKPRRKK